MTSMKMLQIYKSPAQMCQICRQYTRVYTQLTYRNFSNMKQHACTVNARVIKSSHLQIDPNILGCTFRVPAFTSLINPCTLEFNPSNLKSETSLSRNGDHGDTDRRLADCPSNHTFIQEHSNQFSSFGNMKCTNNDSLHNHTKGTREFTRYKQSKYCVTESNLEYINDKSISSIQHFNSTLNSGNKIQEHSCTSVSDFKIKCNSQLRRRSKGDMLNNKRISTLTSALNFLQNRHTSLVKQTCCMFHTSTRSRLLHSVDNEHDSVDIKLSPPWKVKFFGTDEIAVITLKALYENMTTSGTLVESIDVVTVPQMHDVHRFAKSVNLPVEVWPIKVEPCKHDVGILVSFGHMIPDSIIHMFPYGILNMHPSLLPRWRGASPIIHTVLNGDTTTGVSIMEIRPRHFDIGPLLLQRKIAVPSRCTSYQLLDILGPFGSNMVLECLKDLPKLERFEHEQNTAGITYAHKLKRSDAYIDWERHTATQIDCQYRAVSELMPLKTLLFGETVKLKDVVDPDLLADITSHDIKGFHGNLNTTVPGTVVYSTKHDCMVIKCKDGFIGFRNIIIKNRISAKDFHNGYIQQRKSCTRFTSLSNNLNKYVKLERIPVGSKV